MKRIIIVSVIVLLFVSAGGKTKALEDDLPTSWKAQRDFKVEKQQRDFSCGVASLSTILKEEFNDDATEEDLIRQLTLIKNITSEVSSSEVKYYSLLDIKKLAEARGYKAEGLALNFEGLKKIEKPVIVFIMPGDINHFSVVSKIDDHYVYLADPSWGNAKYIHEKFIAMWKTRKDPLFYGRVLVIKNMPPTGSRP